MATRLGALSAVETVENTTLLPVAKAAEAMGAPSANGIVASTSTLSGSTTLITTTAACAAVPPPKKARPVPTSKTALVRGCTVRIFAASGPTLLESKYTAALVVGGCVVSRLTWMTP
jgi:hypothetical protein